MLSFLFAEPPQAPAAAPATAPVQPAAAPSQEQLQQQWLFAEGLFQRGFLKDSLPEFERLCRADGVFARNALLRCGECCEKLGRLPDAITHLLRYLELEKDPALAARATLRLVSLYEKNQALADARKRACDMAAGRGPLWDTAAYEGARLALLLKENDAARLLLQLVCQAEAAVTDPVIRTCAQTALADQELSLGNEELALSLLAQAASSEAPPAIVERPITLLLELRNRKGANAETAALFDLLRRRCPASKALVPCAVKAALARIRLKQYREAQACLAELPPADPLQLSWIHFASALASFHLQDYEAAHKGFTQARAAGFPEKDSLAAHLQFCLARLQRDEEACAAAKSFLADHPGSRWLPDVLLSGAYCARQLQDLPRALEFVQKALDARLPGWDGLQGAFVCKAELLLQSKLPAAAAQTYLDLADALTDSAAASSARLDAAALLLDAGLHARAIPLCLQLLQPQPAPGTATPLFARATLLLVELHAAAGALPAALSSAAELAPSLAAPDAAALDLSLAGILARAGRSKEALARLELALPALAEPQDLGRALLLKTMLLREAGDEGAAARAAAIIFTRALPCPSLSDPVRRLDIIRLLERQRLVDTALIALQDSPPSLDTTLQKARLFLRSARFQDAIALLAPLQQDLARDPQRLAATATLAALLGEAYARSGDFVSASPCLEQALRIGLAEPDDLLRAFYGMALLKQARGAHEDAWRLACRVYITGDDWLYSPAAIILAAQAAERAGLKTEARSAIDELRRRFPAEADAPATRDIIGRLAL